MIMMNNGKGLKWMRTWWNTCTMELSCFPSLVYPVSMALVILMPSSFLAQSNKKWPYIRINLKVTRSKECQSSTSWWTTPPIWTQMNTTTPWAKANSRISTELCPHTFTRRRTSTFKNATKWANNLLILNVELTINSCNNPRFTKTI